MPEHKITPTVVSNLGNNNFDYEDVQFRENITASSDKGPEKWFHLKF